MAGRGCIKLTMASRSLLLRSSTPKTRASFLKTCAQLSRKLHTSANPTEVSHFSNLAQSWWDPAGPSRLLHLMNPLRHDFIFSCMKTTSAPPHRLRYLDVGCGGGIFAESAARLASTVSVTAIDPSSAVIAAAREHAAADPDLQDPSRLRYIEGGIETLPIPQRHADGVDVLALWEVIEHVDNPAEFLRVCMQHVKPGGWLVMSTIARTWSSWMVTKLFAEDLLRVVPRGTHDWSKYILESELRSFFEKEAGWASAEEGIRSDGCIYIPGLGWRLLAGGEEVGNYFFGVRRDVASATDL